MTKAVSILTFLLSLGPKLPQAVALLRQLVATAKAFAELVAPGLLDPMLIGSGAAPKDGVLGLTADTAFSVEELELEGRVLKLIAEQPSIPGKELVTLPVIQAGGLLKTLLLLERLGVGDALLSFLMSRLMPQLYTDQAVSEASTEPSAAAA